MRCTRYSIWATGLRSILNEKHADEIIDIASGFNLEAQVIGHCEASDKKRLTIDIEKELRILIAQSLRH